MASSPLPPTCRLAARVTLHPTCGFLPWGLPGPDSAQWRPARRAIGRKSGPPADPRECPYPGASESKASVGSPPGEAAKPRVEQKPGDGVLRSGPPRGLLSQRAEARSCQRVLGGWLGPAHPWLPPTTTNTRSLHGPRTEHGVSPCDQVMWYDTQALRTGRCSGDLGSLQEPFTRGALSGANSQL